MSKTRSAVNDYLVSVIIRCVVTIIHVIPFSWSCQIARGLAWILFRVDRRHREVARDNLRPCLRGPGYPKWRSKR